MMFELLVQSMPDPTDPIWLWAERTFLFVAIIAIMKGWFVPGKIHDREVKKNDFMFNLLLRTTESAERATHVAEEIATKNLNRK